MSKTLEYYREAHNELIGKLEVMPPSDKKYSLEWIVNQIRKEIILASNLEETGKSAEKVFSRLEGLLKHKKTI